MALPLWITNLTDSVLKADFTAFYNAGQITEAEMTKALMDLAKENSGRTNSTLQANQVSDLQSIADNMGWSMGASTYLQFITNAFVFGNAANATYTGGGANAFALGNLATGYTVNQLDDLIGKWFCGNDLPSDVLLNSKGQTVDSFTFSSVSGNLFGANGPSMSDFNQGIAGDCYFLASLAEVAQQNPSAATIISRSAPATRRSTFRWGPPAASKLSIASTRPSISSRSRSTEGRSSRH